MITITVGGKGPVRFSGLYRVVVIASCIAGLSIWLSGWMEWDHGPGISSWLMLDVSCSTVLDSNN